MLLCLLLQTANVIFSLVLLSFNDENSHGQCDLVLIQNNDFEEGIGLHVHIRTKVESFYSFIESVAVKIGDDVFELLAGHNEHDRAYWINGVKNAALPFMLASEFALHETEITDNGQKFDIYLDSSNDKEKRSDPCHGYSSSDKRFVLIWWVGFGGGKMRFPRIPPF